MPKYYELSPKDHRHFNFTIFFYDPKDGCLKRRPEYFDLECPVCHKFDEFAAVRRYISPDVRIKGDFDYMMSYDGLILMSKRLRELIAQNEIKGIEFIKIPKESKYSIAIPVLRAKVDMPASGLELYNKCAQCGRYGETCFGPLLTSMTIPPGRSIIFAPDQLTEKNGGIRTWLYTTEPVVGIFEKHGITGAEYKEVK